MAARLFFAPKVSLTDPNNPEPYMGPKYFADGTVAPTQWASLDFDTYYLVSADLPAADITLINSQADASVLPVNLDTNLTAGQVTAIQNRLEGMNMPANWVSTSDTWRGVLRVIGGMIRFNQRFKGHGDGAGMFQPGITLSSTVGDLPVGVRQRLNNAATSLGLDTSGITLSTTLRAVYRNLGQQLQNIPLTIGQVTL